MNKIVFAIAVVTFFAVVVTLWQGDRNKEFMKTAMKAYAKVEKTEQRVADPKNQRKEYWVTYSYEVAGSSYTTQELVEFQDIWRSLNEGQVMPIYYSKKTPGESHIAAVLDRRLGLVRKR